MMGGGGGEAERAQRSLAGLFGAGEAAAGLHGANRLGGNSLSDLLVFGRRAGLAAAQHAKEVSVANLDEGQINAAESEALSAFQRKGGENPYAVHPDWQTVMQNLGGISRIREDMEKTLIERAKLKVRAAKTNCDGW